MLYVSRRKDVRGVGVVDTDDDVEEFLSVDKVRDLSLDNVVHIRGVSQNQWTMTVGVFPYQSDKSFTTQQIKMKVLGHVDIKVWRDYITDIFFEKHDITGKATRVVLSDFGSIVADRVLDNCSSRVTGHKVTLVFDDKVSLLPHALLSRETTIPISTSTYGVAVDVTALKNLDTLCMIYIQLFRSYFRYNGGLMNLDVKRSILDNKDRNASLLVACERVLGDTLYRSSDQRTMKALAERMKALYLNGSV